MLNQRPFLKKTFKLLRELGPKVDVIKRPKLQPIVESTLKNDLVLKDSVSNPIFFA